MPPGPPRADHRQGHDVSILARFPGGGSKQLASELQVLLFAVVLLLALRTSPLPGRWPLIIGTVTVIGSLVTFSTSLTGARVGTATEDLWKTLLLLMTVIMVVRRVLARPTVTIQSIYGALSAYLIIGLMFASGYAAIEHLSESAFFANGQPANTQTFQYFSFTTLTTLGYGDFTAAENGGRSIAVREALTAQVFLATLVARLVAAYRTPAQPELAGRLPEDVDGPGDDEDRD